MPDPDPILYLATSGQVGGAERCLVSLIAGLGRDRFEPTVLIGSPGPLEPLLRAHGVAAEVVTLPRELRQLSRYHPNLGWRAKVAPLWQMPAYLAQLRRAGRQRHPRLIHSHGVKMHYLAALLKSSWGAPLIWHLHDFPAVARDGAEPWSNRILNALAGRVDCAIANSNAVAQAYAERLPRLASKLRVLPNGVNTTALQSGDRRALRRSLEWDTEDFVVGMVAIFAPWKGQEIFLEAARQLHPRLPEMKFLLVGDDIYDTGGHGGRRAELESRVRDLGLGGAVRFSGYIGAEIASAYAALDVMVHASTRPEPFGRTIIEAMAAGVPVIAAGAGGVLEIVTPDETGLLTPPGDASALAAAMARLHGDTELRRRLAKQARRHVEMNYSEASVGRAMSAIYREMLAPAAAP